MDSLKEKILITGPARSGKSAMLIDRCVEAVKTGRNFMLIVPNKDWALRYKLEIAERSGGLLGKRISTFNGLIDEIERRADSETAEEVPKYLMLSLVEDCVAEADKAGELDYFGESAEYRGFVSDLHKLFGEFRQSLVSPEDLGNVELRGESGRKLREVQRLYGRFENGCRERGLTDFDRRMQRAVETLESDETLFSDLDILLVDGFYDYNGAQHRMLGMLFERVESAAVTHLYDEGKKEQFRYSQRLVPSFAGQKGLFGGFREVCREEDGEPVSPTAVVWRNLFDTTGGEAVECDAEPGVCVVEEPGVRRLTEEIARRIKRLLIDEGMKPSEIAVIHRGGKKYPEMIRRVFPLFGIPFELSDKRPLNEEPVVIFVRKLLRFDPARGDRRSMMEILRSNYSAFRVDGKPVDEEMVEHFAREAGIAEGRGEFVEMLKSLERDLTGKLAFAEREGDTGKAQSYSKELDGLSTVQGWVNEFLDLFTHPTGRAKIGDYREHLEKLEKGIGMRSALEDTDDITGIARDRSVLERFKKIGDQIEKYSGENGVKFAEYIRLFDRALENENIAYPNSKPDGVAVLKVMQTRGRRFRVVFVCGLTEGEFPLLRHRMPILSGAERKQVDESTGSTLFKDAALVAAEERLLFYISLSRSDEKIYLCRSSMDDDGRELVKSSFLMEVERLFGRFSPEKQLESHTGSITKLSGKPELAASPEELLRAIVQEQKRAGGAVQMTEDTAPNGGRLAEMFEAASRREPGADAPGYKGELVEESSKKRLTGALGEDKVWSATELEHYGKCPYLYMIERVWGLEVEGEPTDELEPMDRGILYHEVMRRYYEELINGIAAEGIDARKRLMSEVVDRVASGMKKRGMNVSGLLWDHEVETLKDVAVGYVKWEEKRLLLMKPEGVEASFGMEKKSTSGEPSTTEPLELGSEEDRVLLKGKIDRIDITEDGERFDVVDYKSGSSIPSKRLVDEGVYLQIPLYMLAAEQLFLKEAEPGEGFYYGLKNLSRRKVVRGRDENWEQIKERTESFVLEYISGIREGRFPVAPKDCQRNCEFTDLCRYAGESPT